MEPVHFFALSVLVLAALLFFPLSSLVWALSVRRLERRTGSPLGEEALRGQRARARFIAVLLAVAFSFLYNLHLLGAGHA